MSLWVCEWVKLRNVRACFAAKKIRLSQTDGAWAELGNKGCPKMLFENFWFKSKFEYKEVIYKEILTFRLSSNFPKKMRIIMKPYQSVQQEIKWLG